MAASEQRMRTQILRHSTQKGQLLCTQISLLALLNPDPRIAAIPFTFKGALCTHHHYLTA
jgi:hypothetical protein